MIAVLTGGFGASVGGREYQCESGDVAVLPADLRHAEKMGPRGARSIVVMPTGESFEHELADAIPDLAVFRNPLARRLVWRMAVEWHRGDAAASLGFEHHVEELFLHLAGADVRDRAGGHRPGIDRARDFVEASLFHTPTLDEVAGQAGLSRAQLARTFRRVVGCSVGEYLRRCRVDRAARMLRETDRPISEIAATVGFYDQSHFSACFRRWIGCPPGAFRRMINGR